MVKLTVDGNTSLKDLQRFSEQVGNNQKIRGKVNTDGSITLYTSGKPNTGLKEFFTGHVTNRQNGARQALDQVISNLTKDPNVGEGAKLLLMDLDKPGGEVRGDSFKRFVQEAKQARDQGITFERRLSEAIASGNESEIKPLRDEMIERIGQQLRNEPPEEQFKFATNDVTYKDHVANLMCQQLGGGTFGPSYEQSSGRARQFLDDLCNGIAPNLSNRQLSDTQIEVDGKVYTFDKQIGEGGNGIVDLYKNGDEKIVLKRAKLGGDFKTEQEAFKSYCEEARQHQQAMDVGGDKVVEMKGVIRTQEGGLRIALKFVPGGDSFGAMENINKLLAEGLITPSQAQAMHATMLKDMLESLQSFQEGGMTHQDLKPPNFFIDEGGKTKMADFGTAKLGNDVRQQKALVDNPLWLAPELLLNHERKININNFNKPKNFTPIDDLRKMFKDTGISETDLDTMMAKIQKSRQDKIVKDVKVEQKVDTWALGVTAYQMFQGTDPLGMQGMGFVFEKEKAIKAFGTGTELMFTPRDGGQLTDEQNLINELMHPDPDKRSSPKQTLENPIFKKEGVGSQEIRDFLLDPALRKKPEELTEQDKTRIRDFSNKLQF